MQERFIGRKVRNAWRAASGTQKRRDTHILSLSGGQDKVVWKVSVLAKNESHSRSHANTHAMKKKHAIGPKMSEMMRYRELS